MDSGMDGVVAARVGAAVIARSVFASSLRAPATQSSSEPEVLDCFVATAPRNDDRQRGSPGGLAREGGAAHYCCFL